MTRSRYASLQTGIVRTRHSRQVEQTVATIRQQWGERPRVGVILGSGLGEFVHSLELAAVLPYGALPHFPCSTAEGHAGRLALGTWSGLPVAVLQGRCHLYEGYTREQVTYPIRVLHALGVETLIISCAAGGLARDLHVGDLLVLDDHIDLQFRSHGTACESPRRGGVRVYCAEDVSRLTSLARALSIPARRGVYIAVTGPNYETRAELRFLQRLGDAVGMSTVPEACLALALGMQVSGLALITNVCNPDRSEPADGDHVLEVARQAQPRFRALVLEFLRALSSDG